jgi:phospholipid/cholesterol/gamma-HCH transport system substrate-binding protein
MSRATRRRTGVPLGRTAIAIQVILALLVSGFLITRFDVSLPLLNQTYDVEAILPDAAGLDASHRPQVVAAGVPVGRVTAVRFSPATGQAVATLQLSDATRGKLFRDAAIRIIPRSALQDLVVDIDPGTPSAGPLEPGVTIVARPKATPVTYEQVLGTLDADTQAYAQILIGTLRQLLRNRPGPLRAALDRLPALDSPVTRLAQELARHRHDLTELVTEFAKITSATARRRSQLADAIRVARATLEVTAARQLEIERAFAELPATLRRVHTSLDAVQRLAVPLEPALVGLLPTARALPGALRATRRLLPSVRGLIDDARPVVTHERAPLGALTDALGELAPTARLILPILPVLRHFLATLSNNHDDIMALLDNWPGAISATGNTGIETRTLVIGTESLLPALFGVDTPAQASQLAQAVSSLRARRPRLLSGAPNEMAGSPLREAVWALLVSACKTNTFACVYASHLPQQLAAAPNLGHG